MKTVVKFSNKVSEATNVKLYCNEKKIPKTLKVTKNQIIIITGKVVKIELHNKYTLGFKVY